MEITIEKGDGSTFSPETGGDQRKSATIQVYLSLNLVLYKQAVLVFYALLWIQVVIDGYSAPLTAGNFAKLVR